LPPSVVVNTRPSAAVAVAFEPSVARIAARSILSGKATRCHVRPSLDTRTRPPGPTSQQIVEDGAAPVVSRTGKPVD